MYDPLVIIKKVNLSFTGSFAPINLFYFFPSSASYDTSVKLWNTEQGVCLHTLNRHLEPVNSISFSMDGKYLASGTLDGLVNFWAVQVSVHHIFLYITLILDVQQIGRRLDSSRY